VPTRKFDPRQGSPAEELLSPFRDAAHKPFVQLEDLRETRLVLDALPRLEFPINSAGELVDKLNRAGGQLQIVGLAVDPAFMVGRVPPHYFPIASLENFAEKIADLIRQNRKKVNVTEELKGVKSQLPKKMRFPIANVEELVEQLGAKKAYKYRGGSVEPGEIADRIPREIFPIASEKDFDLKISALMANEPLIVADRPTKDPRARK